MIQPCVPWKVSGMRKRAGLEPVVMGATMTVRRCPVISLGGMTKRGRVFRISPLRVGAHWTGQVSPPFITRPVRRRLRWRVPATPAPRRPVRRAAARLAQRRPATRPACAAAPYRTGATVSAGACKRPFGHGRRNRLCRRHGLLAAASGGVSIRRSLAHRCAASVPARASATGSGARQLPGRFPSAALLGRLRQGQHVPACRARCAIACSAVDNGGAHQATGDSRTAADHGGAAHGGSQLAADAGVQQGLARGDCFARHRGGPATHSKGAANFRVTAWRCALPGGRGGAAGHSKNDRRGQI